MAKRASVNPHASELLASDLILGDHLEEKELAAALGVTIRTTFRWREIGYGPPPTKIGRRWFYKKKSTLEWLAAQEREPAKRDGRKRARR